MFAMNHKVHHRLRAGFSALEMLVAVTVLSLLAGSLSMSLKHMRGLTTTGTSQATLQAASERALRRISADLSRSGSINLMGNAYPFLFDDGAAIDAFAGHAHPAATHTAVAGEPDFGPTREVVFVLPREADLPGTYGRDVPDIDINANLIWDVTEFSYVLITGVDGINYLQRRVNGAAPTTIASNVERVVFDDNPSSGFVLPVDTIRVRLFFRKTDAQGVVHRYTAEQIIKLRNGV
jgi:prepilin-type N-terminal cleavage/methylation domain-containing protein